MPEGPEVRKYADALGKALDGKHILEIAARTKAAKGWLAEHPGLLVGRRIERIWAHGKNLLGEIEGGYYFHSHLMMWGRWVIVEGDEPIPADRRERARIQVPGVTALLWSAPVFELGRGNPMELDAYLNTLGPDALPYAGDFDRETFLRHLDNPARSHETIGAALLDQTIIAGIGNYLRAEILFDCRLDPWRPLSELTEADRDCLCRTVPLMVRRAYETGATATDAFRELMAQDETLVYQPGKEIGTRHHVFRRTNLPCLVCGGPIRQLRQVTRQDEEGERTRIIYFCPVCQKTSVPLKPVRKPRKVVTP